MTVWFVATGPGDPALLTVETEGLLARAEAVAYEPGASAEVLALAGDRAKVVEVEHGDVSAVGLLAQAHDTVVRLGTGDRLALEAGGVEARTLRADGVEVRVAAVVLAATALPASVGTPVMSRDLAPVLTIAVGPLDAMVSADRSSTDRSHTAMPGTTVVTLPDAGAPTVDVAGAVAELDLRRPGDEVGP